MSDQNRVVIDWILGVATATTAVVSSLDTVEQWIRIVLAVLSCISVFMLIMINRKKFYNEMKNLFNKCPE